MSVSLGGRGKKAPYETTHVRVPVPLKAKVDHLIEEWRGHVDTGTLSPTEPVTDLYKTVDYAQLSFEDALIEAKKILVQKKSANDSLIKLLTSIYSVNLPKDALRK